MIKILLKLWPALIPIILYLLWVYIAKDLKKKFQSKKNIDGEYKIVGKGSTPYSKNHTANESVYSFDKKVEKFSLHNPYFLASLYCSMVLMILALIFTAINK